MRIKVIIGAVLATAALAGCGTATSPAPAVTPTPVVAVETPDPPQGYPLSDSFNVGDCTEAGGVADIVNLICVGAGPTAPAPVKATPVVIKVAPKVVVKTAPKVAPVVKDEPVVVSAPAPVVMPQLQCNTTVVGSACYSVSAS